MTPEKAQSARGLLLFLVLSLSLSALAAVPQSSLLTRAGSRNLPSVERLTLKDVLIDDSAGGDGDGRIEPGERARLRIGLTNVVSPASAGAEAVLTTTTPDLVEVIEERARPALDPHQRSAQFDFEIELTSESPCGQRIELQLHWTDAAESRLLPFELIAGLAHARPAALIAEDALQLSLTQDAEGFAALVDRNDGSFELIQLRPDGTVRNRIPFPLTNTRAPQALTLRWNASEYGLSWIETDAGRNDLMFVRLGVDGRPLGSEERVAGGVQTETAPHLLWHAAESAWLVAAQQADRWIVGQLDVNGRRSGALRTLEIPVDRELSIGANSDGLQLAWIESDVWYLAQFDLRGRELDRRSFELIGTPHPGSARFEAGHLLYHALFDENAAVVVRQWDSFEPELLAHVDAADSLTLARNAAAFVDGACAQMALPDQSAFRVIGSDVADGVHLAAHQDQWLVAWLQRGSVWVRSYSDLECTVGGGGSEDPPETRADEITCDGTDNDSNPATPDAPDVDLDTFDVCGPGDPVNPDGKDADCNDTRNDIYPGALEFCDGANNDCDAQTDEVTGTRYIAPTGSDTGNLCTAQGTPCQTFAHSQNAACINEFIMVAEGVYNENVIVNKRVVFDNSGASTNTTVQGSGTGDVVTFHATGAFWDGIEVRGGGSNRACVRIGDAAHPDVRNVNVVNGAFYDCAIGVWVDNTGNDPGFLGVNRLNQVDCRDNDWNGSADSGLGVLVTGLNGRLEIKGGFFRNNASSGIRIKRPVSGTSNNIEITGAIINDNGLNAAANGRAGIEIDGGADVHVEGNDIFNHVGPTGGDDGRGLILSGISDGYMACNRFRSNDTGVLLDNGTTSFSVLHNRINNNSAKGLVIGSATGAGLRIGENVFTGNAAGVDHQGTGTLDAKHNWWGAANGPTGGGGSGDSITGSIDASTFIARAGEPVLVRRPVDSGWAFPAAACYDTLQGAIDANPAGSLLLIGSGSPFFERLTLDKVMDLEGVPASTPGGCSPTDIYGAQGSGANRPALRITNVSGITLKHLWIHAAGEGTAGCNTHTGDEIGLDLQNVDNSTFQDLCIQENGIAEVRIYGDSDNNLFQRVIIDGQLCIPGNGCLCTHRSKHGFLIDGGPACEAGPGAIADDNIIIDSTIHNTTRGIALRLADDTQITNNTIDANPTPDFDGGTYASCIEVGPADDTLIENNTLGGSTETEGVRLFGKTAADCMTEELNGDRTIVRNNTIRTASGPGVFLKRSVTDPGFSAAASITCNDIHQNGTGVQCEEANFGANAAIVTLNDIRQNSAGVRNVGVDTLFAQRNWWNNTSGPSGGGPGSGDSVLGAVDFANWLVSSARADNDGDTFTECQNDCNDTNPNIKPGGTEICNAADDDCDGSIDEGLAFNTFYRDADNDSFGDPNNTTQSCSSAPVGYVANNTDCNDSNPAINPLASEVPCDNVDQRCNGAGDEAPDADADTFDVCGSGDPINPDGKAADCLDTSATVFPGATEIICNGVDNSCNGSADEAPDGDFDGADRCTTTDPFNPDGLVADCDDANPNRAPQLAEICDDIDNDCDGTADDGLANSTFYRDQDGDTYGNPSVTVSDCAAPSGYVGNNQDCNDTNAAINPLAAEVCTDNLDNNCNAQIDDAELVCSELRTSNLRFQSGSKTVLLWDAASGATGHALYRGTIDPGAAWSDNHRSLASELPSATATDSAVPPPATSFYYVSTGIKTAAPSGNITGGPLGRRSDIQSRPESLTISAGPRVYVNPDVIGSAGTGLSWADAYTTVSAAIAHNKAPSRGLEVWVRGTLNNNGNVNLNGASRPGVAILGGFAGTETLQSQRNPLTNITTWRGGAATTLLTATHASVVLDGLTIETGTKGVSLTAAADTLELRGVTVRGFSQRGAEITVDAAGGGSLVIDRSSFDGSAQIAIAGTSTHGALAGAIYRNTITGSTDTAIKLAADPLTATSRITTSIVGNTISNADRGVWALALTDNDGFDAVVTPNVLSNVIHHIANEAVRSEAVGSFSSFTGISTASASPRLIGNTLADANQGVACLVTRTDSSGSPSNHSVLANPAIWNNLITHMNAAGIFESTDSAGTNLSADPVCIANDLFSASPLYRDENSSNLNISQVNALSGNAENFSSDPLYVNRPGNDYHLNAGSPAINAGRSDAPVLASEDLDGGARVVGTAPDVGADER